MKRFIAMGALIFSISLALTLAENAPDASASGGWSAQGSGTVEAPPFPQKWQWSAKSGVGTGTAGIAATGHFEARNADGDGFSADVTCLNVIDKTQARMGLRVTQSTGAPSPLVGTQLYVTMRTSGDGWRQENLVGAGGAVFAPNFCPPPSGAINFFDGTIQIQG